MLTPSGHIHCSSSHGLAHAKAGSRRSGAPRPINNNNNIVSIVDLVNLGLVDVAGLASEASGALSAAAL